MLAGMCSVCNINRYVCVWLQLCVALCPVGGLGGWSGVGGAILPGPTETTIKPGVTLIRWPFHGPERDAPTLVVSPLAAFNNCISGSETRSGARTPPRPPPHLMGREMTSSLLSLIRGAGGLQRRSRDLTGGRVRG